MWKPGTIIIASNPRAINTLERLRTGRLADYLTLISSEKKLDVRVRHALVISVQQTGYGTKGYKWDALLLYGGFLLALKSSNKVADLFDTHETQKETQDE